MPGNISEFLADIRERGIAKTSHFDVQLTPPVVVIEPDSTGIAPLLTLRCESAELPGRQIGTTDNRIYGPIYKTPYDSIYAETTFTFVDTAEMDIRKFFERWMNQIFDSETNTIHYIDDIVTDIFVRQYDVSGTTESLNTILQFQLFRAFPTNINQLTTSWGDDAPHKLNVTFFYEYYIIDEKKMQTNFATVNDLTDPTQSPAFYEATPKSLEDLEDTTRNFREIARIAEIEKELPGYSTKTQATNPPSSPPGTGGAGTDSGERAELQRAGEVLRLAKQSNADTRRLIQKINEENEMLKRKVKGILPGSTSI